MNNRIGFLLSIIILLGATCVMAQTKPAATPATNANATAPIVVYAYIDQNGDTVPWITLREVTITAPYMFKDANDYNRYRTYRSHAAIVQPYAIEAVKTYRQLVSETKNAGRRDRKKRISELQDKMSFQFKDPLKKLSKTQGIILVKMIERELNIPFYDLIKDLKGGFTAIYWNEFSKFYGYRLKDGYKPGEDTILDAVLQDFDISYYTSVTP